MRAKTFQLLTMVLTIFFLTSCANVTQHTQVPTPEPGKATIVGAIHTSKNQPYNQITVRLAEIYWQGDQGAYVLDESTSPSAVSDSQGYFQILNVPEGEYVLIVSKSMDEYHAVTKPDGKMLMVTAKAGDAQDLGLIKFDY